MAEAPCEYAVILTDEAWARLGVSRGYGEGGGK